jgi:hypothetical protein
MPPSNPSKLVDRLKEAADRIAKVRQAAQALASARSLPEGEPGQTAGAATVSPASPIGKG